MSNQSEILKLKKENQKLFEENENLIRKNEQLIEQIQKLNEKQEEINDNLCFLRKENKKLLSFIRRFNQFEDSQKNFHDNGIKNSIKKIENFVTIKEETSIKEHFISEYILDKCFEKNVSCLNIQTNINNLVDKKLKVKQFNQNITNISESSIKIKKIEFTSTWGKIKLLEND